MTAKLLNSNQRHEGVERWLAGVFAAAAISVGWFIPEFYDWTGADQSRPAPVVGWIGLGVLIADGLLLLLLARLHLSRSVHSEESSSRWRFNVSHILVSMTWVAIFLMFARLTSVKIACWLLQAAAAGVAIRLAVQIPRMRFWIAWTAFLQFAPFLWLSRTMGLIDLRSSLFAFLSGRPTLVPAAFFVQPNLESMQWLLTLLTTIEFAICLWLSYLGPKRALAGGIVVLTLSIFSSFALNAVMRM